MGRQCIIGAIAPTNSKREWRTKNPVILVGEYVCIYAWWESGTKSKIFIRSNQKTILETGI